MALKPSKHLNIGEIEIVPPAKSKRSKKTIEQTFTKLTQLEHVLLRPDTYIGSVERIQQQTWVWDEAQNRITQRDIGYSPGLYKIFDEILVNAADHKQRDASMNTIKVEIDSENQFISVWNNGSGIPVEFHQKEKIYVPELIFGNLLTSSNYDDNEKKVVGGRNGFGAKLANIFSTEFVVETADNQRGKKYKQVFRNNMSQKDDPIIKSNPRKESFTKITFYPDLSRFGMTFMDDDIIALMKKRVYDVAGINSSLKVYLNGQKLPIKTFKDYVSMYTREIESAPVLHERLNDRWEVAVTASDGQLSQVSFVNSIWTIKGGTHVTHVADQIVKTIGEHISKKNKGLKVKPFQIKNHLSLFVNCLIENPAFDSQTKETLTTKASKFGSKWQFTDELAKKVVKSEIIQNVLEFARFKQNKELSKTDGGKKARVIGIPKLEDANKAGGREASKCTLILTEGDSAKALAISGLSVVGRDYYGVFPLRGKLLNVREANHKQIMDNAEINNLKKIIGLQHNKTYNSDNVKSLRYGHVLIMADQDHDGSHIKGLVINFFDHFWPSLLQVPGFLQEFITPIVKCTKGKNNRVFFTMPEYKRWITASGIEADSWKQKYYKGLGTSTAAEAKDYFSNLPKHLHEFQFTGENDSDMIELAFSKQRVNDRKTWLSDFTPGTFFEHGVDDLSYSNFVNKELILFSIADNARSIPSVVDGLKPSQRKVLFACFKRKLTKSEIKVVQLAGYVAEHAAYHHGEMSLQSTIVGLAQNFVGSNNLNLLVPAGQFGTRLQGGKDAASSRYIFTKLASVTRALFPELDDAVLKYLEDDGLKIEPEWYCPIIPMVLVNGSDGIGTGWSSSVPCYNPRDLIKCMRKLLRGQEMAPIRPWYRGFSGSIVEVENSNSFDVYGTLKKGTDPNFFKVDELPIRSWTSPYKEFLEQSVVGNPNGKSPFIKEFHDNSTENKVSFSFTSTDESSTTLSTPAAYKKLKLVSTLSTNNMVLFDSNGRIRKYQNTEEIIREFFDTRLGVYEKRRFHILAALEHDVMVLSNKQRFIKLVIDGKLKVAKRKKVELMAELKKLKFDPVYKGNDNEPNSSDDEEEEDDERSTESGKLEKGYDYLLSMPLWSLTAEKITQLGDQKDKKISERDEMKRTTPSELWEKDLVKLEDALDKDDASAEKMARDLERVARNAQARQRKGGKGKRGKMTKSYAEMEGDDLDLEVVTLPAIRSVAVKKPRAKKVVVPKPKATKLPVASRQASRKTAKKKATPVMILDDDDISDDSFDNFSGSEELVDLVDKVTLDDDSPIVSKTSKKMSALTKDIDAMSGDDSPIVRKPTRGRKQRNAKKKTVHYEESDEDLMLVANDETQMGSMFDDESDMEEPLSLRERIGKKNGPKRGSQEGRVKAGASKRVRDPKLKKKFADTLQTSPSGSPQPKKTRLKSPHKNAVGLTKKAVSRKVESEDEDSEGEDEILPIATRPRRQRAAAVKAVISLDTDEDDMGDEFEPSDDDDDSDYE